MTAAFLAPPDGRRVAPPLASGADYWDGIAVAWGESAPQRLWRHHADAVNRDLCRRWLPSASPQRVLKTDLFDEAVGAGLYPALAEKARRVAALDVSPRAVAAARARYPALLASQSDVRHLPFRDGIFDAVVSTSTLDHFPTAAEIDVGLAEVHRVLRRGGVLVLTLDNPGSPFVAVRNALPDTLRAASRIVPYYVGATYGRRHLRQVLDEVGFRVVDAGAIVHCPRVAAVAAGEVFERYAGRRTQAAFLRLLAGFEGLAGWPTRYLTGHFVAMRAVK